MRILRVGIPSRSWLFCLHAPETKAKKCASRPAQKGLNLGHEGHQTLFFNCGHIFKAWALVEKVASV